MAKNQGGCSIPPWVFHDDRLKPRAKLLYGRIHALSLKQGYCYATDSYLSEEFNASERTIRRWIRELEDAGHIRRQYEQSKHGKVRHIWPLTPADKSVRWGQTPGQTSATQRTSDRDPADKSVHRGKESSFREKKAGSRPTDVENSRETVMGRPIDSPFWRTRGGREWKQELIEAGEWPDG